MAVKLLTIAEYARHRGCDEKAVRVAIANKRITVVEQDGKRLIDPDVADIQWARNTRARARNAAAPAQPPVGKAATPPASPDGGYADARARRERAEAEEAELRVARAAGRAIDRERAERATFDAFRELRDASFAACKSMARKVIGVNEVREAELALEEEMRGVFAGWEDRMRARIQEAAAQ